MTQEDKTLLLKDLCARLPYRTKVRRYRYTTPIDSIQSVELLGLGWLEELYGEEAEFKPYLFPLSSLTEEQRNDISKLLIETQNEFSPYGKLNMKGCDNLFICSVKQSNALINYCLTNHLDINGLIKKGLAIDATGLNIY